MLTAWYAFPKDHLQTVVAQSAGPEPTLRAMTTEVQTLLPR